MFLRIITCCVVVLAVSNVLLVENDSCKEVERRYWQHKEPSILNLLLKVINSLFDILLFLYESSSPFLVVVDVYDFFRLIFCVTLEMFFILYIVVWEWEASKFWALSVGFGPPLSLTAVLVEVFPVRDGSSICFFCLKWLWFEEEIYQSSQGRQYGHIRPPLFRQYIKVDISFLWVYVGVIYFGYEPHKRWHSRVFGGDPNVDMEFPALVAWPLWPKNECLPVIEVTVNATGPNELFR